MGPDAVRRLRWRGQRPWRVRRNWPRSGSRSWTRCAATRYRAGARRCFPFDLVRVSHARRGGGPGRSVPQRLLPPVPGARNSGTSARAGHVRFSEQLRVEVEVATGLPLPDEPWLTVAVGIAGASGRVTEERPGWWCARDVANVAGTVRSTSRACISAAKSDVYRNGGMHRRNDLAFVEDSEVNRSVSREHAHIDYDTHHGRVPAVQRSLVRAGNRLRHADRARWQ